MQYVIKRRVMLGLALLVFSSKGVGFASNPKGPTTGPKAAGVNTVFVYNYYLVDTAGAKLPGSNEFDTMTVIATGVKYLGKTNVLSERVGQTFMPEIFLNYEANGDVSEYADSHGEPGAINGWITYPVVTRHPTAFLHLDTTITGTHTRHTLIDSVTYLGKGKITVAGRSLDAYQISNRTFDESNKIANQTTFWLDAATGVLLKINAPIAGTMHVAELARIEMH